MRRLLKDWTIDNWDTTVITTSSYVVDHRDHHPFIVKTSALRWYCSGSGSGSLDRWLTTAASALLLALAAMTVGQVVRCGSGAYMSGWQLTRRACYVHVSMLVTSIAVYHTLWHVPGNVFREQPDVMACVRVCLTYLMATSTYLAMDRLAAASSVAAWQYVALMASVVLDVVSRLALTGLGRYLPPDPGLSIVLTTFAVLAPTCVPRALAHTYVVVMGGCSLAWTVGLLTGMCRLATDTAATVTMVVTCLMFSRWTAL